MIPRDRKGKDPLGPNLGKDEDIHDIFHPNQTHQEDENSESQMKKSERSSFMLDDDEESEEGGNGKSETIEKVLNRLGLEKKIQSKENCQELKILVGNIVENCVGSIDEERNLGEYEKQFGEEYSELENSKVKNTSIIVNQLTELEKIELMSDKGLTAIIKQIRIFTKKVSSLCTAIIEHNLFETVILLIIILNSIKMALDDPLTEDDDSPTIENIFVVLYTMEMVIKILAMGFFFNEKAYLRDLWNALDFIIVLTSLLPLVIEIGFSVNSLRAVRVLRPLKTITKVKALKMIVSTLFYSFSLVMDSLYILIFVMLVFSIAGTQLFSGVLKNRCIEIETGFVTDTMCINGATCSDGFTCGKGISSPNFSILNFDTFLWSMLTVFQTLTMEGWSDVMIYLQKTYSPFSFIYSILIVFFCEYVLLNMTMAILKYKYAQVKGNTIEEDEEEETDYEPDFLKKLGVFKDITHLPIQPPLERYFAKDKIFVGALEYNQLKDISENDEAMPSRQASSKRISEKNILKNRKIDLSTLPRNGKIDDYKWDVKALQFQSIDSNNKNQGEKQVRSSHSIKEQKMEKDMIIEQSSFSIEEEDYEESESESQSNADLQEKLYQMQMKLADKSLRHIRDEIEPEMVEEKERKIAVAPQKKNRNNFTLSRKIEMNELNNILKMAEDHHSISTPNKVRSQWLPHINFQEFKVEKLYERFNDLGEYRIKRQQKVNQLAFFNINHSKSSKPFIIKQNENSSHKELVEETSLDIKELQLVNELIKKKMKCRIKKKAAFDEMDEYNVNRVLVLRNIEEEESKKEELKENMKSLNFKVSYKINPAANQQAFEQNIFTRSFNSQYKGLKITEMGVMKQDKNRRGSSHSSVHLSRTVKYIKLLQNHKMEEKIEIEEDRIMSIFFKKEKEVEEMPLTRLETEYNQIKEADIFNRHGHVTMHCPIDSLGDQEEDFISSINIKDEEYEIYMKGIFGIITVIRNKTLLFITRPVYDNAMLLLVIANTLTLSLNGIVDTTQPVFIKMNTAFSIAFAVDLVLKIFAYGFDFFGDIMNLFDSFVVSISIVELTIGSGGSNLSALRSVRILRAFRVLRITRLIRSLNYMKIVMSVVSSVITEFVYIFMLLVLFIFIYTLLGMQIFGGQLLPEETTGIRQNFDTFFNAVFSVFQILTMENWNDIETTALNSPVGYFSIFYIVSWIFIGNWILLNLLQAILLDGFDNDSSIENQEEEEDDEIPVEEERSEEKSASEEQEEQEHKYEKLDASLLLFYPNSWVRMAAIAISSSKIFQNFIIFAIGLSSIKLVLDTYLPGSGEIVKISDTMDIVFNSIFIFECVVKIISKGLIIGENTYLKDSWCKLDFFIVITAVIDMSLGIDLSILKLFRTLRPLRIVSRNPDMKVMISSLAQSMCGIFNVIIIILCIFLMFGILGINLLQGKLNYCNPSPQLTYGTYGPFDTNEAACLEEGGVWTTQFVNFDNILDSLLSLYVFSTRENWPYYVYTFIDSDEDGPIKDKSQLLYMLYSVVIIFVCSYFFMDLLVGVLFMNFHEAEAKIRPQTLNDKQINWKNLQKIIIEEDPCFQLYMKPQHPFKKLFYWIVTCRAFEMGITLCILGNIIVMMVAQDDQTEERKQTLSNINFAFSLIFILEMVLKLLAFNQAYFLSGWNIFDFFVVIASILDIILDQTGSNSAQSSAISILPQIARIFRVLRVTKLLRMFKRFKGLQKLIETFIFSLPALARGLSIVCLFLFISSVLASYLFSTITRDYSGYIDQFRNFKNFHRSLQTLFIITSGENWYIYMYESIKPGYVVCENGGNSCVDSAYLIFWLIYVFFSQKVFMELFVLIVLDQFESNYIKENNPLGIFSLFEEDFRNNWIEVTSKYHSIKIETKRLLDLILVLKQPLGLGKHDLMLKYEEELRENEKLTDEQIHNSLKELDMKLKKNAAKLIQKMDIIKNRLYLGYQETFYRFAKLAMAAGVTENSTEAQKEQINQIHKESEEKLLELMPDGNNFSFEEEQNSQLDALNPIEMILFSQMIIKSWQNYALKIDLLKDKEKNKRDEKNANDSLNESCSSQIDDAELVKLPATRKLEKRKGLMETNINMDPELKMMPNIDEHYQIERKRGKGNSSNLQVRFKNRNSRGSKSRQSQIGQLLTLIKPQMKRQPSSDVEQ